MDITKRIEQASETGLKQFQSDPTFRDLEKFYLEMLQQGIAKKQEYNLPLLDTIGLLFKTQR